MPPDENFCRLAVWQAAVCFLPLAAAIAFTAALRALDDPLRRASLPIPLNIAEGSGKSTGPDQGRFYTIARGSAMECAAILDACTALALIDQPRAEEVDQLLLSAVRMLSKMCYVPLPDSLAKEASSFANLSSTLAKESAGCS